MDKGTLIYIILGILYMLFSAGNKKKKNAQKSRPAQNQPPKSSNNDMSLEDMISALRGETKAKPKPVEEVKVLEAEPKYEKLKVNKEPKPAVKYKNIEAEAILKNDHKALDPKDYEDGIEFHFVDEEDDSEGVEFDARKAVIYHEIMKRPEY